MFHELFRLTSTSKPQTHKQITRRIMHILDAVEADPTAKTPPFGAAPINCLRLCSLRDGCLRNAGFRDPYATIKANENSKAIKLLPAVLKEVDAISDDSKRLDFVIKGVFAGNIFDLGAPGTAQMYEDGGDAGAMFESAKSALLPRPWAVDTLDATLMRFADASKGPHKKAIVFVDNAGADVVLGMLPFARELLRRGTEVVFAANEIASINDMTANEMGDVVAGAATVDAALRSAVAVGRLRVVSSGSDQPGIDLRQVSMEVAAEAEGADLVVLEGMGRGIETNLYAEFLVDSLKLAMIKHKEVAQCLEGRMYDPVCQFMPGTVRT
jgi:damage-control phosphatase, subfamily II, stand-alone protein